MGQCKSNIQLTSFYCSKMVVSLSYLFYLYHWYESRTQYPIYPFSSACNRVNLNILQYVHSQCPYRRTHIHAPPLVQHHISSTWRINFLPDGQKLLFLINSGGLILRSLLFAWTGMEQNANKSHYVKWCNTNPSQLDHDSYSYNLCSISALYIRVWAISLW